MPYYITPKYSVALNTKVGSSTFAQAILQAYYPEMWSKIVNAAYPPGKGPEDIRWHSRCERELDATKPVVLPVREPVSRFMSACAQSNLGQEDMNAVLDSLESGTILQRTRPINVKENEHFRFQYLLQQNETHLFKFPDHLEELANLVGLEWPLPKVNERGLRREPTLLSSQLLRVEEYYARDIELFNSITKPDTVVNVDPESLVPPPKEPVPGHVTPLQIRKWLILHGISMPMIDAALSSIPDATVRQIAQAEWEFGLVVERNNPMINQFGAAFGLTPSVMDQAFRDASTYYI